MPTTESKRKGAHQKPSLSDVLVASLRGPLAARGTFGKSTTAKNANKMSGDYANVLGSLALANTLSSPRGSNHEAQTFPHESENDPNATTGTFSTHMIMKKQASNLVHIQRKKRWNALQAEGVVGAETVMIRDVNTGEWRPQTEFKSGNNERLDDVAVRKNAGVGPDANLLAASFNASILSPRVVGPTTDPTVPVFHSPRLNRQHQLSTVQLQSDNRINRAAQDHYEGKLSDAEAGALHCLPTPKGEDKNAMWSLLQKRADINRSKGWDAVGHPTHKPFNEPHAPPGSSQKEPTVKRQLVGTFGTSTRMHEPTVWYQGGSWEPRSGTVSDAHIHGSQTARVGPASTQRVARSTTPRDQKIYQGGGESARRFHNTSTLSHQQSHHGHGKSISTAVTPQGQPLDPHLGSTHRSDDGESITTSRSRAHHHAPHPPPLATNNASGSGQQQHYAETLRKERAKKRAEKLETERRQKKMATLNDQLSEFEARVDISDDDDDDDYVRIGVHPSKDTKKKDAKKKRLGGKSQKASEGERGSSPTEPSPPPPESPKKVAVGRQNRFKPTSMVSGSWGKGGNRKSEFVQAAINTIVSLFCDVQTPDIMVRYAGFTNRHAPVVLQYGESEHLLKLRSEGYFFTLQHTSGMTQNQFSYFLRECTCQGTMDLQTERLERVFQCLATEVSGTKRLGVAEIVNHIATALLTPSTNNSIDFFVRCFDPADCGKVPIHIFTPKFVRKFIERYVSEGAQKAWRLLLLALEALQDDEHFRWLVDVYLAPPTTMAQQQINAMMQQAEQKRLLSANSSPNMKGDAPNGGEGGTAAPSPKHDPLDGVSGVFNTGAAPNLDSTQAPPPAHNNNELSASHSMAVQMVQSSAALVPENTAPPLVPLSGGMAPGAGGSGPPIPTFQGPSSKHGVKIVEAKCVILSMPQLVEFFKVNDFTFHTDCVDVKRALQF